MTERGLGVRERHYCSKCRTRYTTRGMCPSHPGVPLLDLGDPEARLALTNADRLARMERMGKIVGISLLVSVPLSTVLASLIPALWAEAGALVYYAVVVVAQLGIIALVALLSVLFFRREPALTLREAEILALEAARKADDAPPLRDA